MRRFDPYRLSHAVIAQLVEQTRCKRQVVGSSPTGRSSPPRAIFFTQGDNIRSPGAYLLALTASRSNGQRRSMSDWCSGNTPAFQAGIAGSIPVSDSHICK